MSAERLIESLKLLFKKSAEGAVLQPANIPNTESTWSSKKDAKPKKKPDIVAKTAGAQPEAAPETPQDAEVVRKAIIRVGQEAGRPLTVAEKMNVLVSDSFRTDVGIRDEKLLGGISRLSHEVDWNDPSVHEWEKVRSILGGMPNMRGLEEQDQMVLREVRQAALEYYYRNSPKINAPDVTIETVLKDKTFEGASVDRIHRDQRQAMFGALSDHPENSAAWAKDIADQFMEPDKLKWAPEITRTVSPEQANAKIQEKIATSPDYSWLITNGEIITDPAVAQVIYDIIRADKAGLTKEFLLVKGVQIKELGGKKGLGETAEGKLVGKLVDERNKFRERFNKHVKQMYIDEVSSKADPAEGEKAGKRAEKVISLLETGVGGAAGGDRHKWSVAEDPIPTDPRFASLQAQLDDYNLRVQEISDRLNTLKADRTSSIRQLQQVQDELDAAIVDMLVIRIPVMTSEEIALVPNLLIKLESYRVGVVKQRIEQGRGYNSLYVPEAKTRDYILNALNEIRLGNDRSLKIRRLLPTQLQESSDQALKQSIQYLQSDEYRREAIAFIDDPINWPDIEAETGVPVDSANKYDHPFYRRVKDDKLYERFRDKITDALTFPDLLENDYTSWQLGKQEDIGVGMSGFGEPGIMAILNNRGINTDTFDVLETLYGNMVGPNGEQVVASGPVQEKVLAEAVDFLDAHKELIQHKFKDAYGPNVELTRDEIFASVKEVNMLMAITGERAKAARRVLSQVEGAGRGINPAAFAGEASGDNKINQAIEPMRQFFIRWKVANDVQKVWMEIVAKIRARTLGVDVKWKKIIDELELHGPKYNELVKHAFVILDDDKEHIKSQLSVLEYDLKGKKIKFSPEKISDVTKDQLLRWLIIRDGTSLADPALTAGYTYFEASWNMSEQVRGYDEHFGPNKGIATLERLRLEAAGVFDITKDHHELEHAREKLYHRSDAHPEDDGALVDAGRYMPSYILRALHGQKNDLAEEFIRTHFDGYNKFHDQLRPGMLTEDMEGAISKERPDLFFKRYELTLTMINRGLADWEDRSNPVLMRLESDHPDRLKAKGLPAVDWSKGRIDDPRQMEVVRQWCIARGIDPNDFIAISKNISDFALRKDVLEEASHPLIVKSLMDVRKKDARLFRLDEGVKIWADVPVPDGTPENLRAISEYIRHRYIGKWSSRIANVEGFGASGGLPRWIGDQMNSRSVIVSDLIPISKSKSSKEWEQHIDKYVDTIVNTGGDTSRIDVSYVLTMANIIPNRIDLWRDLTGTSDDTYLEISINERVGGKGYQAYTMNDADHVLHHGEAVAGVKFHKALPHMDHETMRQAGLVVPILRWPKFMNDFGEFLGKKLPDRVTIGKKTFRINLGKRAERFFNGELNLKSVWAYRIIAFLGLGVLMAALQSAENIKKGYTEASSGGGASHPS